MIRLQAEPLAVEEEYAAFARRVGGRAGAVVMFSGLMRGVSQGAELRAMVLEHYPGMGERQIGRLAEAARERFGLTALWIVHRYGRVFPGEAIVVVLAAARHRRAAFEGASFLIDWLKTRAPFWKKEELAAGPARWVSPSAADAARAQGWGQAARRRRTRAS